MRMDRYRFTEYFDSEVLQRRPYLTRALCVRVVQNPAASAVQPDGRIRFWAISAELAGRLLQVLTLADGLTIHNAFIDRGVAP